MAHPIVELTPEQVDKAARLLAKRRGFDGPYINRVSAAYKEEVQNFMLLLRCVAEVIDNDDNRS